MLIFVDGLATVESCFEVLHSGDVEDGVGECLASCHHVSAVCFCFVASSRVLREVGVDDRSSVVDVEQILAAGWISRILAILAEIRIIPSRQNTTSCRRVCFRISILAKLVRVDGEIVLSFGEGDGCSPELVDYVSLR